jgi:mRNA interferase MazF
MAKPFDKWNRVKKATDATSDEKRPFFHDAEIWWVRFGVNIGYETDGKSDEFTRPAIVLKKYNQYSFLAVPLSTSERPSPYRLPIGTVAGKQASAILSQLRNMDSKRLVRKIGKLPEEALDAIRKEASRVNFG